MTMTTNTHLSLNDWLIKLSNIEIPAMQYTLDQMSHLHSKSDDISIRDLSLLIRHDPLLTLKLIRYQQRQRRAVQMKDVNTIEHVLLMIGMGGFFREFGSTQAVETQLQQQPDALVGIRKIISRSYLAARIAESLSSQRHDVDPIEVTTASLLHDLAEILLWLSAPALAQKITHYLLKNPGSRSHEAQKLILGFTINELQTELALHWHLPSLLTHLMDERHTDEPRVRTVSIATSAARHLANHWQDPALPDDYQNIADLLSIEPEHAYALVRNVCIKAGHEWEWFSVLPVATQIPQF
ncbi:HDOD domain-containing protein [Iodobacter sp. HSC-16F04]|uniref:HDOD domain-containing protein n=1 Tax=Iodobacter violaceini TaxID=3044271 RepID=A0ABX0KWX8_9NEIS|nr:HDOD domain-containing protein [Iodobacter violacea]NHQ88314.1 HDOD domain-containing protein [Iodobacter violacea]